MLSIILAGCGQLVKMIITLEQNDIFRSHLAYLFILKLSSHWYVKLVQGFVEHHFGGSRSFSENAHNS